jgi:4-amino-4-deoxy-L-arabinose transferase-like glycosyltransferase
MSRRAAVALCSVLLLAAAVRLAWFTGLQEIGDGIVYSRIAVDRLHGTVHFQNVHQMRHGFNLPLLASYAAFGPGERPLVLYNLLCSVGLVAACFGLARRFFGEPAGLAAAAVAALHPNLVRFATECHTDTPVALWHALAVWAVLAAVDAPRPRALLVLAGLLLGWAWLHKEHAVFLIPFVAGHWLATRRRWTWYLPMALAALAVFLAEIAGNALWAGGPWRRFEMVRYWHSGQYMAADYPTTSSILYRLVLDLPVRLVARWQGVTVAAALLGALPLLLRAVPGARAVAGWFAAIYAGYAFWPSSLSPFLPGFHLFDWTLPVLQAPLVVLLGAALARLRLPAAAPALAALSALNLALVHAAWVQDRRFTDGPREARAWIEAHRPARVVADEKTVEALDFFDGHAPRRRYLSFQDADGLGGSVIVVDAFWTAPGAWWSKPVPEAVRRPPASWIKIYESPRIVIYRT